MVWKHLLSAPPRAARSLLPSSSSRGKVFLASSSSARFLDSRQHLAALRADLQLGPLCAILFCNEDIMILLILSKIVEIVSSQIITGEEVGKIK